MIGQQPGFLRLGQRDRADAEQFRGLPDHAHPGRVVGGRDTQQGLRGGGQPAAAVQEDPLHPLGQRQVRRQRLPTGELGRRERPGQLDQSQRVPPGLPHQPVPDVVGDRHTGPVGEQRGRGGRVDAAHHQLGQFAALETADVTVAGREQQRNPFRSEPAGHEKQCGGGCLVQPMRVVDDAQHR